MGGRGRGLWKSSCCAGWGRGGVTEQLLIGQSSVTSGQVSWKQPVSCCCSTFLGF